MTTFAYHFHAKERHESNGLALESHGVLTTTERIDDPDKYAALCIDIAKFMDFETPDDIVVTSLTYLHEVP